MNEPITNFTLTSISQETEDITNFDFAVPDGFHWQAGQYLDWQIPHDNADSRGQRRFFSIASAPSDNIVRLSSRFTPVDGSTLKRTLAAAQVGQVIGAKGPFGEFTVTSVDRPLIFVAGGIGITPFRAILRDMAAQGMLTNVQLLYGNRSEQNVPYKTELEALAAQNPGFTVQYIYSPAKIDEQILSAAIQSVSSPLIYLSGLEKMVEALKELLLHMGVSQDDIKLDDFGGYDANVPAPIF